jgi:uncharacterized protein YkwD
MKTRSVIILVFGILTITACQPAPSTPPEINVAQTETQVAAAINAGLTSTASAKISANETLTAAALTPTSTPANPNDPSGPHQPSSQCLLGQYGRKD